MVTHVRMKSLDFASTVAPFELPIVVYLAFNGFVGMILGPKSTPNTLDDTLPYWMVFTWAMTLFLGGVLASAGLWQQSRYLEASGLVVLMWPCVVYAAVLPAVAGLTGVAAAVAYLAIITGCILRLRVLKRAGQARRVATQILLSEVDD